MDYNKIPVNTESEITEGKFSAVTINFNPAKKEYSWTLYFKLNDELHPVRPNRITGQVKTWPSKSKTISNLKKYIEKLKDIPTNPVHNVECELGENWKDCPACLETRDE